MSNEDVIETEDMYVYRFSAFVDLLKSTQYDVEKRREYGTIEDDLAAR